MDKLGDMEIFVRIVRAGTLAAAGRELGLSPASVTARLQGLEGRHGVKLLTRTTRGSKPTEAGLEFYDACVRILAEVAEAEIRMQTGRNDFAGPLRVSAPSDLGQQHVAPLLSAFVDAHPGVTPFLHLADGVVSLVHNEIDLAIRYGVMADSGLMSRRLAPNHRVLCASPNYLERRGTPTAPSNLTDHDCLAMVRVTEPMVAWHFQTKEGPVTVRIEPKRLSNDGALIRRWAVEGAGVAVKSYLDVASDLRQGRLVEVLQGVKVGFSAHSGAHNPDLHVVHSSRSRFLPRRVSGFIEALVAHFRDLD